MSPASNSAFSATGSATVRTALVQLLAQAVETVGIAVSAPIVVEQPAEPERGDLASPAALQLIRTLTPEQRRKFHSPLELARQLADELRVLLAAPDSALLNKAIAAVEVAPPGFINVRYSQQFLLQQALTLAGGQEAGKANKTDQPTELPTRAVDDMADQRVVIEYVSPNTNKPLHIGHLRNAALGWSLSKLLAADGAQVQRAIIFNDRGLHIMKSCWGYLAAGRHDALWSEALREGMLPSSASSSTNPPAVVSSPATPSESSASNPFATYESLTTTLDWQAAVRAWHTSPDQWLRPEDMTESRLRKSDHFIGFWYQLADRSAETEVVASQWSAMLQCWEDPTHEQHAPLRALWQTMNDWFYAGFEQTRQRFGFGFDENDVSYESQIYQKGKDLVVAAADQGIFERLPDGAITARLEGAGLPDKILLRRDGTGIYMTFDIELTRQRTAGNAQQLIWIVGEDQKLYFQQLFTVAQQLGYGEVDRYYHLAYALVYLPSGKMSSRKGLVLYADDILELAVQRARTIMEETGSKDHLAPEEFAHVAEAVGIGAVKWTMLSVDPLSKITFDVATSVSFTGFAGPYVQYTHARACSVLRHAESSIAIDFDLLKNVLIENTELQLNEAEIDIVRNLCTYYEIVRRSAQTRAPHLLCNYLYELCQRFNTLYASSPIASDATLNPTTKQLRLMLTKAVVRVLAEGLELLGLTAVQRM